MTYKLGFTLVELIIVISIIVVLSTIGLVSFSNIQKNSKAAKMAADFQQIKLAWKMWKNANDTIYPREDIFGTSHPDLACEDEPGISQTPANLYLDKEYNDPWGIEYSYDNDGNTFPINGREGGVNILSSWCAGNGQRYIEIAQIIDRSIDNGDGATLGQVRWTTNINAIGAIIFMIAPNENQ